eukprot:8726324-Pyramimonas_sp.AAC.1
MARMRRHMQTIKGNVQEGGPKNCMQQSTHVNATQHFQSTAVRRSNKNTLARKVAALAAVASVRGRGRWRRSI